MSISLYAHGTAQIEIGKYGGTLEQAKEKFIESCEKLNLIPTISEAINRITFDFKFGSKNLHKFLSEMAIVEDLHGDPPDRYSLVQNYLDPGVYIKTGSYND